MHGPDTGKAILHRASAHQFPHSDDGLDAHGQQPCSAEACFDSLSGLRLDRSSDAYTRGRMNFGEARWLRSAFTPHA